MLVSRHSQAAWGFSCIRFDRRKVPGFLMRRWAFLRLAGALAVGAARPATGAAFAGGEIFLGTGNATPSSVGFLGVFYPADPFVARQWGDGLLPVAATVAGLLVGATPTCFQALA